eukprot:2386132-Prymnesium_polylepis.1
MSRARSSRNAGTRAVFWNCSHAGEGGRSCKKELSTICFRRGCRIAPRCQRWLEVDNHHEAASACTEGPFEGTGRRQSVRVVSGTILSPLSLPPK